MTMTLFGMAGMSIDAARIMFVRERLISACDAAALAGGKVVNAGSYVKVGTGPGAKQVPQWQYDAWQYFALNFPTGYYGVTPVTSTPNVSLNSDGTQVTVQQSVQLPLVFGSFLGQSGSLQVSATSVAFAGKVDVAMVLDNTGSMAANVPGDSGSKISLLRTAAIDFVNDLTTLGNNNVRIAVVPFTMTVNVGSSYAGQSWLDPKASYMYGGSPLRNALDPNLSSFTDIFVDPSTGKNQQTDRMQLFNSLTAGGKAAGWAGCVEMRPAVYDPVAQTTTRYDVQDLPAVAGTPASLFVPFFAPSEPTKGTMTHFVTSNGNYQPYTNDYMFDLAADDALTTPNAWQAQQGDYKKYASGSMNISSWQQSQANSDKGTPNLLGYALGPNAGCQGFDQTSTNNNGQNTGAFMTLQPLMRLTTNTVSLTSEINGMLPMGGTYLPVGMFWGWETISPNSVFPDNQVPYSNHDVSKVVILLTDGCNELMDINNWAYPTNYPNGCNNFPSNPGATPNANESFYQAGGYVWQNRQGVIINSSNTNSPESARATAADNALNTMCTNMKAEGITIYTIGVGLSNSYSPALQTCATDSGKFFAVTQPSSQLDAKFQQIAHDLTTVRIISTADSTP